MNQIVVVLIVSIVSPTISLSQADSANIPQEKNIHTTRLALVVGGAAGIIVVSHLQNYNSWWKGTLGPFHTSTGIDDGYSLGADKLGHFLFTYYAADAMGNSLVWSGLDSSKSFFYGSLAAFVFQMYVEIEDGFHPELGFSFGDAYADFLGASLPLLRLQPKYTSFFKAISPKWSASPSQRYKNHYFRSIIDDYESQYYWLSFNIRELWGESSPTFIPSFLNIALGYGVTNLDLKGSGEREFYLSLDCDWNKLPGKGDFLSALKHALNYFHFPAPTIRLAPSVIMYGIRF